ncbi:hypothetical protein RB195_022861 [Necator americanus]|uniref:Phlebovirus glycoprotein G2 fusion domain-containing protein n=1 Tax=Necator americanus TaxID=51031 RepID=A0ABR1EJ30_NECAM
MITRSKARLISSSTLLCLTILFSAHVITAINTRCPEEININKTLFYATTSTSKGIAIARYEHIGKEVMCWFPIHCPLGHIRFEQSTLHTSSTLCGETCKCPQWATSCSFSTGSSTTISGLEMIPQALREYRPSYVCSFNFSSDCDSTKKMEIFNQIQLFEDNILVVEKLTLSIKDYLDKYDFVCVDRKGWRRRPNRYMTGTSLFCEKHECRQNACLFCTYDSPLALLVIDESQDATLGSIPIKAWGSVMKVYYEYQAISLTSKTNEETNRHVLADTTSRNFTSSAQEETLLSSIECIQGGLSILSEITFDVLEACIRQYCVFAQKVRDQPIIFPNSVIMYDYTASIKAWTDGKLVQATRLSCKAHQICETLHCIFCWERMYNPQCWTTEQIITIICFAIMIIISLPWLCLLCKIFCLLVRVTCFIFSTLNPFNRLTSSLCRKPPNPMMYTNRRKRLRSRKSSKFCVMCLIALIPHTDGCSQVISINAHEEVCTITDNAETCTYNEATVITLQPLQQETCLATKDRSNKLVAVISLKVDNIQFRCQKNVEFFTRDHKLISESIHQCYLAGSCVENACENTSPSDQLKGFSHTANNSPGCTFCSQSCGCITCEGCFFCQPSCLFYRIYALPTSHTNYTVFNCPS